MSREIDLTDLENLSGDDKMYLAQRGLLPTSVASVEEQRQALDPETNALTLEQRANTGDVNTANLSVEDLEALLELKRAELKGSEPSIKPEGEAGATSEDEGLEPPYDQYTKPQLLLEIDERNEGREEDDKIVPAGTTKPEIIAALEADDEDEE